MTNSVDMQMEHGVEEITFDETEMSRINTTASTVLWALDGARPIVSAHCLGRVLGPVCVGASTNDGGIAYGDHAMQVLDALIMHIRHVAALEIDNILAGMPDAADGEAAPAD